MPATCNASYPRSSSWRCCGSISRASAGDTLKKALSKCSASLKKPPCRARSRISVGRLSAPRMLQRDNGTSAIVSVAVLVVLRNMDAVETPPASEPTLGPRFADLLSRKPSCTRMLCGSGPEMAELKCAAIWRNVG
eukprot:scaffold21797_cov112-Isochrysis_galbana.AAC.4